MLSEKEIREIFLKLRDENPAVHNAARAKMFSMKDERCLFLAVDMLHEDSEECVYAAFYAIAGLPHLHPSRIISKIIPFLDNPAYCQEAIWLLSKIGNSQIVPNLKPFLLHLDAEIRYYALKTIDSLTIDDKSDIALLMLNDDVGKIRALACRILGRTGNHAFMPSIVAKLYDTEITGGLDNETVGAVAAKALAKMGSQRATQYLKVAMQHGHEALALSAFEVLRQYGRNSMGDFFMEHLAHPSEKLRQAIIRSFAYSQQPKHVSMMIDVLENDPIYHVRMVAADTLQSMGTPEAREAAAHWNKYFRRKDA